jgi:phosphopantothenoylcysteine synthetase/decarboxylase
MFLADEAEAEIELMPLPKEIADQLWRTSRHKYIAAEIGHIRVLQGTPLEDALHFLRRRASAQTSAETSDMEGRKRRRDESDESDEEVGDKKNKSGSRSAGEEQPGNQDRCHNFDRDNPKDHNKYKNGVLG